MSQRTLCAIALGALVAFAGPAHPGFANGQPHGDSHLPHRVESKFRFAAAIGCLQLQLPRPCRVESIARRELGEGLAHYQVEVRVGPETFDVIRVHRVVRERRPGVAKRTRRAILLGHGSASSFEGSFLQEVLTSVERPEGDFASFLAEGGVDVWGVDLRYVHVPGDTEDLAFMADWGLGVAVSDTRVALRIARLFRWFTGNGYGRVHLGGWSQGGVIAYAVADAEAKLPRWRRDVRGLVGLDSPFKVDPLFEPVSCFVQDFLQGQIDAGIVFDDLRDGKAVWSLALSAPDEVSPFDPNLTNRQLALLQDTGSEPPFTLHANAGIFDASGFPTDYAHATDLFIFELRSGPVPAFYPDRIALDMNLAGCNRDDSPFDDSLGDIEVPHLYIAAAGGFTFVGFQTAALLGSSDVTVTQVQLRPPEEAALDFGHGDIVEANNAGELVWQQVLDWVSSH